MSDATVFIAIAFAAVWMKRKNRWKLFFQALEGTVVLGSSQAVQNTNTNTTPGNNPNDAPITVGNGEKAT